MQNKGFVKVFSVLLTLVCLFYLSFSFVTRHYTNKAADYAKGDPKLEEEYLDSIANEKVWLWNYTLKQCREMEIGLGLDLKGGMNVILEVSVGDILKSLADHNPSEAFNKAIANAEKAKENSQKDFITLFVQEYHKLAPGKPLAELFATQQMRDKVSQKSSDAEVEKVLREEAKSAIDNSYNVLRTRIDRFGVVQPNIQALENSMGRIMVELPGVKEPERVRRLLQGSANLEFWETFDAKTILPYLQGVENTIRSMQDGTNTKDTVAIVEEVTVTDSVTQPAADKKSNLASMLKTKETGKNEKANKADLEKAKKEHPLFTIFQPNQSGQGCMLGYALAKDTAQINKYFAMPEVINQLPRELRLKWGVKPAEFDPSGKIFELYAIKSTSRDGRAPLEGDVITDARDEFDQNNQQVVGMTMNSEGAREWAQLTKQNVGHCIAIVLDGFVYSAPNVNNEITGGRSSISGHFTPEEAKDLANVLKSGKMPAPAHIVQEDVIGPSLGQESINAGIMSFVVAIILLMVYMCSLYGFIPGMIANLALIFNMFFTLGILASFQAALTLSGIAGMVLTLGIAVDANVLIYERTKEELRAGKNVKQALSDGYSNAFSAIFDSNLTSIITGVILFNFGTGPILGFATTLIIGILVSFFTAVFMTRVTYEYFMGKNKWLNLTFDSPISRKLFVHTSFDFIGTTKKVFTFLGILVVLCIITFSTRGLSESIDFTGGRNYVVEFKQPTTPEEVRSTIGNKFGDQTSVTAIALGTDGKKVRISTNYGIQSGSESVDQEIEQIITKNLPGSTIISSQKVGPSVANDIKIGAIWAVGLSLLAIGIYILIRFKNIAFSAGSVIALGVDTLLVFGAYSAFWGILPFSMEIDQTFIAAILTVIGYSINDKVVIFDRVREFLGLYPNRNKKQLFDDSLNTTLSRTINTSGSALLVLICIFVLGADSIRSFAFAMGLGVIVGTLSSIFVAAPIAYLIMKKQDSKKKA